MATTASPISTPTSKPQKRLFHSLSRFLSGKSRPKVAGTTVNTRFNQGGGGRNNVSNINSNNINNNGNDFMRETEGGIGEGVPLREVGNRRRSTVDSLNSSSIGGERMRGDGASEISGISSLGNSARGGGGGGDDGGADTDASIRPISPGSLAPSSILSRETSASNISYAPTHGTYASTKPTTIFSVESGAGGGGGGGGANRIAVVPGTGLGEMALPNPLTNHSASPPSISSQQSINPISNPINPGITFSALPNATTTTTTSTFNPNSPYNSRLSPGTTDQAPRFTTAHPRNNPHPASPPPDNASMLTLASSSFAPSFAPSRYTSGGGGGGASLSGLRARVEADEDASVRALAPSRRASDESLGSRSTWSAAVGNKEATASLRTVGTGGTGGELLGVGGSGISGGGGSAMVEGGGTEDITGVETEAQKVVRKEGGDKMKLDLGGGGEGGGNLGVKEMMIEGEHQRTPTAEIDSMLPISGAPLPSSLSPQTEESVVSFHSAVSTPPSESTPPASTPSLQLLKDSLVGNSNDS